MQKNKSFQRWELGLYWVCTPEKDLQGGVGNTWPKERIDLLRWGSDTNTSQHPMINRSSVIYTETTKSCNLFNKICHDHYFWEEKIWLTLSWLLGTWLEYALKNAELSHLCFSAYGNEINNFILTVYIVLILLSLIVIISGCLSVALRFRKEKKPSKKYQKWIKTIQI